MMNERKRIFKAAGIIGSATLLSRVLGMVRDMVVAAVFGAGFATDAFIAAFRIPNLMRRLFAEGSLTVSFVPVFTGILKKDGREAAFVMARSAFRILSLILVVLAILGVVCAPLIIRVFAPGFLRDPAVFDMAVNLTRIMFPYVFFICLVALCMGVLNALNHFAAPALAPVLLNIALIGAAIGIAPFFETPVYALGVGVIIGGMLQLGSQLPVLYHFGFKFRGETPWIHPGVTTVARMMLPAVLGAAVYQINILVGTVLASLLPEGAVSYLYFADRLVQFPLALFGISLATAILPTLSRQAADHDKPAVKRTLAEGLQLVLFINTPAMVGLILLREPIIEVLFMRGAFQPDMVVETGRALMAYGVGLCVFSAVRVVVAPFYALKDSKTPMWCAVISISVNITLGILLMKPLGHAGLALATSVASAVNVAALMFFLSRRLDGLVWKSMVPAIAKTVVAAGAMGACLVPVAGLWDTGWPLILRAGALCGMIIFGILVYAFCAIIFKSPEMATLLAIIRKKTS